MAAIPGYKRIYYTDYDQKDQKLVTQLASTINNSFTDLYSVIQNGVSLQDNIYASVNDITVTVNASGTPTTPVSWTVANSTTIEGVQVIRVTGASNTYPTATPYITYTQNGTKITAINVAGLPASTTFTLRVVSYLGE